MKLQRDRNARASLGQKSAFGWSDAYPRSRRTLPRSAKTTDTGLNPVANTPNDSVTTSVRKDSILQHW
jgi:hypothetical protein